MRWPIAAMLGIYVAVVVTMFARPLHAADNYLSFEPNALSGEEWEFVRKHHFTDENVEIIAEVGALFESLPPEQRVDAVLEDGRERAILSARFDIHEDGVPELFVYLGFGLFCGTAGCDTPVLERVAGELRELTIDKRRNWVPILRDEDRSTYYKRSDPRHQRLAKRYGFPTYILDTWQETLKGSPVIGAEYVVPDRADEALYWPPETMQRVDDEMRRRVGDQWDEIVREANKLLAKPR